MSRIKREKQGLLIKGALEKIPVEVIEDATFRKRLREIMKGWSGIYALYKDDKVYYVGKSINDFWRLWRHYQRDRHVGKWDKFSVFRFKTKNLPALETLVLHISKPKGNKAIPRIPKDVELTKILKNEVKQARKTAQRIEKAIKG